MNAYKQMNIKFSSKFRNQANETIQIKSMASNELPDISVFSEIGRQEPFSVFVPKHQRVAGQLVKHMMDYRSLDDLLSCCAYLRDRINPQLFHYALSVTLLHRPDTEGTELPSFAETFPCKFFNGAVFNQIRMISNIMDENDTEMRVS